MARKPLNQKKSEALAKLEAAKAELVRIEKAEAERVGRLVIRAGLTEIDISDNDLLEAFKEIAARFQGQEEAVTSTQDTPEHSAFGNGNSSYE